VAGNHKWLPLVALQLQGDDGPAGGLFTTRRE